MRKCLFMMSLSRKASVYLKMFACCKATFIFRYYQANNNTNTRLDNLLKMLSVAISRKEIILVIINTQPRISNSNKHQEPTFFKIKLYAQAKLHSQD